MCPSKALRRVCQGCRSITHQQQFEISCPTARKERFAVRSECPYYHRENIDINNFVCDSCVKSIGWDRDMMRS
ncbi:hypothetical protein PG990_013002 [Apiospora arundinis]|uniref:Uncharacterized protein n=1 Tax=Apiospora arundinis TaxID=335852 RepID=A0ABR2HS99_9PEZI